MNTEDMYCKDIEEKDPEDRGLKEKDLINLICWLAQTVSEMDNVRSEALSLEPEECKDKLAMSFPVVQGTKNQFSLTRIGKHAPLALRAEIVDGVEEYLKKHSDKDPEAAP